MFSKVREISTKLGLAFGTILVILLAIGFYIAFEYFKSMETYKNYSFMRMEQLNTVCHLNTDLQEQVREWDGILLKGSNPDELKIYQNEIGNLDKEIIGYITTLRLSAVSFEKSENIKFLNELENIYLLLQNTRKEALGIFLKNYDGKLVDTKVGNIEASLFEITRILSNTPQDVTVSIKEVAQSRTKIEPVLVVASEAEALDVLRRMAENAEIGLDTGKTIPLPIGLSSAGIGVIKEGDIIVIRQTDAKRIVLSIDDLSGTVTVRRADSSGNVSNETMMISDIVEGVNTGLINVEHAEVPQVEQPVQPKISVQALRQHLVDLQNKAWQSGIICDSFS